MTPQNGDFQFFRMVYDINGNYDYTAVDYMRPPVSGDCLFYFKGGQPAGEGAQCLSLADFVVTLLSSSDMNSMKSSMSLATVASSGAYSDLSGLPTNLSTFTNDTGFVSSASLSSTLSAYATTSALTSGLSAKLDTPAGTTSQYVRGNGSIATFPTIPSNTNQLTNGAAFVDQSGARSAISLTTTGSGGASYNSATGVINVPTYTPPAVTQNDNVARSLNSNFTVSASQRCRVNYSINVQWNLSALLSGSATAFFEYSVNGGSSWVTVSQVSKNIGLLTFAGSDDMNLSGEAPAGALERIRTTAANMTVTYVRGQEIIG